MVPRVAFPLAVCLALGLALAPSVRAESPPAHRHILEMKLENAALGGGAPENMKHAEREHIGDAPGWVEFATASSSFAQDGVSWSLTAGADGETALTLSAPVGDSDDLIGALAGGALPDEVELFAPAGSTGMYERYHVITLEPVRIASLSIHEEPASGAARVSISLVVLALGYDSVEVPVSGSPPARAGEAGLLLLEIETATGSRSTWEIYGFSHEVISPRDAASSSGIILTRPFGTASSQLWSELAQGTDSLSSVAIVVVQPAASAGGEQHFYTIQLSDPTLDSIRIEDGPAGLQENISLHFGAYHTKYQEQYRQGP